MPRPPPGPLTERVREELGLPLRVGIAGPKFLAKLAAEEAGSDGVRVVAPGEEQKFLDPLPVLRLPGVGPATASRLAELGADTIGSVARLPRDRVEDSLGGHGRSVWDLAQGQDAGRVRVTPHRKSLSQESSFAAEQLDTQAILGMLESLAESLEAGLRREDLRTRRVTLKLRYADQEVSTRSRTLSRAVASASDIQAAAAQLLGRTQAGSRPVRAVGISLAALTPADRDDQQLTLFPPAR